MSDDEESSNFSEQYEDASDMEPEDVGIHNGEFSDHEGEEEVVGRAPVDVNAEANEDREPLEMEVNPVIRQVVRLLGLDGGVRAEWRVDGLNMEEDSDSSSDEEEMDDQPQENLDVQMPASHGYLFRSGGSDDLPSPSWIEPGTTVELPLVNLEVVLLPDQFLPLQTSIPTYRSTILFAIQNTSYLAMLPFLTQQQDNEYGTLMQINRFSDDGTTIKVHGVGRQRFKLRERKTQIDGSRTGVVEVLSERLLIPLPRDFLMQSDLRFNKKQQLSLGSIITGIPKWLINSSSTEYRCQTLAEWMKHWFTESKVKCALDMGIINFSFFVAANLPVDLTTKARFLQENCTDRRIADLQDTVLQMSDIVCSDCGSEVCRISDICNLNAEGNSSHFVNNNGYVHEMLTVSTARNFLPKGRPTGQYSWFEGYKWQIIECSFCMQHMGWEFTSRKYLPSKFYGLTRKSVKPNTLKQDEQC